MSQEVLVNHGLALLALAVGERADYIQNLTRARNPGHSLQTQAQQRLTDFHFPLTVSPSFCRGSRSTFTLVTPQIFLPVDL